MALFRIAQEGLSNVHRHSGTRRVRVRLRLVAGSVVELRVEDDGRGFRDPCAAGGGGTADEVRSLGVGIPGMRARLRQLGGTLRIETGAGGTRVIATAPLPGPGAGMQRAGPATARGPALGEPAPVDLLTHPGG